MVTMPKHIPAK